jgi:hypothetical protein
MHTAPDTDADLSADSDKTEDSHKVTFTAQNTDDVEIANPSKDTINSKDNDTSHNPRSKSDRNVYADFSDLLAIEP